MSLWMQMLLFFKQKKELNIELNIECYVKQTNLAESQGDS